jgi:hypothetical protein
VGAAKIHIPVSHGKAEPDLPLTMPTATSTRPPVGHKRHPYGWSARQAAQLADIPARTVQQWAVDGLVEPTSTHPDPDIDQPIYNLGDVVRLKHTRDLLDAGVDRAVVTAANSELATHPQPDHFWDHRRIAHKRWWLLLPSTKDQLADLAQQGEDIIVFIDDTTITASQQNPDPGEQWKQHDPSTLLTINDPDDDPITLCYPLWQTINNITHAIEIWRCKNRIKLQDLPPWM